MLLDRMERFLEALFVRLFGQRARMPDPGDQSCRAPGSESEGATAEQVEGPVEGDASEGSTRRWKNSQLQIRLVVSFGPEAGAEFTCTREVIVGRLPEAGIVLTDPTVSKRHFRLSPRGSAWQVEDLGSTNGTFVNGRKVKCQTLQPGDVIRAGLSVIKVTVGERRE